MGQQESEDSKKVEREDILFRIFLDHPYQAGEGYFEHLLFTLRYGFYVILTGIIFIIHGFFPCIFQTAAGDRTFKLAAIFAERRNNFQKKQKANE